MERCNGPSVICGRSGVAELSAKASSIQQAAEGRFFLPYFLARRTNFTQTVFARNQPRLTRTR